MAQTVRPLCTAAAAAAARPLARRQRSDEISQTRGSDFIFRETQSFVSVPPLCGCRNADNTAEAKVAASEEWDCAGPADGGCEVRAKPCTAATRSRWYRRCCRESKAVASVSYVVGATMDCATGRAVENRLSVSSHTASQSGASGDRRGVPPPPTLSGLLLTTMLRPWKIFTRSSYQGPSAVLRLMLYAL